MEWTKLRTMPGTGWSLLALVAFTVAVGALAAASVDTAHCAPRCEEDTARLTLAGVYLGQVAVVALAAQAVTAEYDAMMIRTTLAASPRRGTVLAAKALVVTAVVLGAGLLGVLGSWLAGRGILPGNGYPALSLADEPTRRAFLGTVLYLGLIALLSLGVGAIVRHTAGAITAVLSALYVVPIVALLVSDPLWRDRLLKYAPMSAGLAIQATKGLDALPVGPWAGLGLLAGYAAAAVVSSAVLFKIRDA
jgi:ABC-2 type transport system permease protein